jgi:hypothetical protein
LTALLVVSMFDPEMHYSSQTSSVVVLLLFLFAPALASDTELKKYEPDVSYVEDGEERLGYDATLLELSDAQRVAGAMREMHGDAGFPLVYRIPGVDGFFLVSSYADDHGFEDHGRRLFLLQEDDGGLKGIYRGRGMADSYILRPTFFTGPGKVLILAETGTEYSWGLQAYEFAGGTLVALDSLDVAVCDGDNHVNALLQANVSFGAEGFRVDFPYDLTLDPGSPYQWDLPRLKETIRFRQDHDRFVLSDDSVGNQACFFFLGEPQEEGAAEALDDLLHYYDEMVPWLSDHDVAYSYQSSSPLHMVGAGGEEVLVDEAELELELGVVLLARDGRQKILYGVHTDVDLIHELESFFGGRSD